MIQLRSLAGPQMFEREQIIVQLQQQHEIENLEHSYVGGLRQSPIP
jgi:hypothetical protein